MIHAQVKLLCVRIKATRKSENKFLNQENKLAAEKVKTKRPQGPLYLLEHKIFLDSGEERKGKWALVLSRV